MADSGIEAMVAEVDRALAGPQVGAFFDVDGTVIAGYTAAAFYRHRALALDIGPREAARTLAHGLRRGELDEERFGELMALALGPWRGRREADLNELGRRLFAQELAGSLYPEAWTLVQAHRRRGHTVVLASSATRFQLRPLAEELGVEHILCTEAKTRRGVLTGTVDGAPLWRAAKARAVSDFAHSREIDLAQSFAYSNGYEDIPMLESVGRPRPVNADPRLEREAARRGWPVRRFDGRGRPGLSTVVRTAAAYGGLFTGFGVGLGLGLLNGSRRKGAGLGLSLGGDIALALAGISVEVQHAERLWSHRPAVFIANHQSPLDFPVVCGLLRGGFSAVAKKEARTTPVGPVLWLADVAFVDRSSRNGARAALGPALERLSQGASVVITPEGTRSLSPRLGPFKKGAFHLAIEAGVPIVPIVIRNTGAAMWRDARTMRPATIEVYVHEPVDVARWKRARLERHVEDVERLYRDTLERWPRNGGSVARAV
jgi:HAD superfamily hydrolase (TIGR01490 family)